MKYIVWKGARCPALLLLVPILVSGILVSPVAEAGPWAGRMVEEDGVTVVENPSTPMTSPSVLPLRELWRVGGEAESDEEFFGVIGKVLVDEDDIVYLLDQQLSRIQVFDRDGKYLRSLGREGEGPGEFRRPADMGFLSDNRIGVAALNPVSVVMLTRDGDPAGMISLGQTGGMVMMRGAEGGGGRMFVHNSTGRPEPGKMVRNTTLTSYDPDSGEPVTTFFQESGSMEFANPVIRETDTGLMDWAPTPRGGLVMSDPAGTYEVSVYAPDGKRERIIRREFEPRRRTSEEMDDVRSRYIIRGMPQPPTIEVLDHDPDIDELYLREDGSLWVLHSRSTDDLEDGELATFDVFDPRGRFARQVTIVGEGDLETDRLYFSRDRIYILRHYTDAVASMWGESGIAGDGDAEEPEPMVVICYALPELDALPGD